MYLIQSYLLLRIGHSFFPGWDHTRSIPMHQYQERDKLHPFSEGLSGALAHQGPQRKQLSNTTVPLL
jgi:hypothetical protein